MFFRRDYNRPGPGVDPNEPRKVGFPRFWEVVSRDWYSFWRSGGLAALAMLPMGACLFFAVETAAVVFYLLAVLMGIPAGIGLVGLYDTVLRGLRDEPGLWFHRYWRAVRRNARACVLPGLLLGLAMALLALNAHEMLTGMRSGWLSVTLFLLRAMVFFAFLSVLWPQAALVDISPLLQLRNAALLCLTIMPRVLLAAAVEVVYFVFMLMYFPVSFLLFLPFNLWLPVTIAAFSIYKPFNEQFGVEEKLKQQSEA